MPEKKGPEPVPTATPNHQSLAPILKAYGLKDRYFDNQLTINTSGADFNPSLYMDSLAESLEIPQVQATLNTLFVTELLKYPSSQVEASCILPPRDIVTISFSPSGDANHPELQPDQQNDFSYYKNVDKRGKTYFDRLSVTRSRIENGTSKPDDVITVIQAKPNHIQSFVGVLRRGFTSRSKEEEVLDLDFSPLNQQGTTTIVDKKSKTTCFVYPDQGLIIVGAKRQKHTNKQ